ncbi:MAG: cytochrome c [Acidobacteriota bacterium]
MSTTKLVVLTLVMATAAVVIVGYLILLSGLVPVAADSGTGTLMASTLDLASSRSVRRHAAGLKDPGIRDPKTLQRAFAEYDETCVTCHGAPGTKAAEFAEKLDPAPPGYDDIAREVPPAEMFWTIKHGIRMTGMPAFGSLHDDDTLWAVVTVMRELPKLSPAQYQARTAGAGHEEHSE